MKPIGLEIGGRVRRHRKAAGLSLEALARLSGVSKAMLSQIEQDKANPTVAVMHKIASAMNLQLVELVEAGAPRLNLEVVRAEDERYLFLSNDRCTVRTLSPLSLEKDIEFYEVRLAGHGELSSEAHFNSTQELVTVARGKVELRSGQKTVVLRKGDSAWYSADVPHALINPGASRAQVYLVVKYRSQR